MTSFHFIWALIFFFLPNKSGIDIGTRREWIIHTYSHIWYTVSKRVSGTRGFHWNLEKEWTWTVIKTSKAPRRWGRQDSSSVWGAHLICCQAYQLSPSGTVPFTDAVEGLSTDNSPICLIPEMPSVKGFLWVYDGGRSQTSAKRCIPHAVQHGLVFSLKEIFQFQADDPVMLARLYRTHFLPSPHADFLFCRNRKTSSWQSRHQKSKGDGF